MACFLTVYASHLDRPVNATAGVCRDRLTGGQFAECAMGAWTLRPRTRMCAPCAPFISQTTPEAADKRNLAAYDAGKSCAVVSFSPTRLHGFYGRRLLE